MCLACEEMDLYFAYLDQQEAKKRLAGQSAPTVELPVKSSGTGLPKVTAAAQFTCEDPAE
jgi:hypothetical protein